MQSIHWGEAKDWHTLQTSFIHLVSNHTLVYQQIVLHSICHKHFTRQDMKTNIFVAAIIDSKCKSHLHMHIFKHNAVLSTTYCFAFSICYHSTSFNLIKIKTPHYKLSDSLQVLLLCVYLPPGYVLFLQRALYVFPSVSCLSHFYNIIFLLACVYFQSWLRALYVFLLGPRLSLFFNILCFILQHSIFLSSFLYSVPYWLDAIHHIFLSVSCLPAFRTFISLQHVLTPFSAVWFLQVCISMSFLYANLCISLSSMLHSKIICLHFQ